MAEVLAIVGGVASIAQILTITISASHEIRQFILDVHEAPQEISRLHEQLNTLHAVLDSTAKVVNGADEDELFPKHLRALLLQALVQVQRDAKKLSDLQSRFEINKVKPGISVRARLRWSLDRSTTRKLCKQLRETEQNLIFVLNLLTFKFSLSTCLATNSNSNLRTTTELRQCPRISGQRHIYNLFIESDSWMRNIGLYGSFTTVYEPSGWQARLQVGFRFPVWLFWKDISINLQLANLRLGQQGISILPSSIRMQNRVPIDSPLLSACLNGKTEEIKQLLRDHAGNVNDRSLCTGQTPLLLAIRSGNLSAIQCVLDAGADPGIGDDNQILPIFALSGIHYDIHGLITLDTPPVEMWLEAMKLLISFGASVHEAVPEDAVNSWEIGESRTHSRVLDFFHVLKTEQFVDFTEAWGLPWPMAIYRAVRAKGEYAPALSFLSRNNVDLTQLLDDGQSLLHIAAHVASDVQPLEYLCNVGCLRHINHKDDLGCTPLHYAVAAEYGHMYQRPFAIIRFLLANGADPNIRGGEDIEYRGVKMPEGEYTPLQLAEALDPIVLEGYLAALRDHGHSIPSEYEPEVFEDALESQV